MAVEDASFKILMLSISLGLIKFNGFEDPLEPKPMSAPAAEVSSPANGTPSTLGRKCKNSNSGRNLCRRSFH